jgi:hypothetical protein
LQRQAGRQKPNGAAVISLDALGILQRRRLALSSNGEDAAHARRIPHQAQGTGAMQKNRRPRGAADNAASELWLQIVERHFEFRECNFSLYPSWLAYPWPHAHLRISGSDPFTLERFERGARPSARTEWGAAESATSSQRETHTAASLPAALFEFARAAPQPAKAVLNLNPGGLARSVSGHLSVFGRRVASIGSSGDLHTLSGIRFRPQLQATAPEQGRSRGTVLIAPDTRIEFVLPFSLARVAQRRPRAGLRVERIERLPSVFVEPAAFRALWPDQPGNTGQRHRLLLQQKTEADEAGVAAQIAGPRF